MQSHTTVVKGLRLYYRTVGDPNSPTLVFLHAWGVRLGRTRQLLGTGFDETLTELGKHYYAIAPEHPGLVRSETLKEFLSYDDYADVLNDLLDQLNISEAIFMGSSFGGGIAVSYASLFPKKVKCLVLIHSVLPKSLHTDTQDVFGPYIKLLNKNIPFLCKKLIVSVVCGTPLSFINRKNLNHRIQFIEREQKCLLDADYLKVSMPVLLIYASDDSKIHPTNIATAWNKSWPNSKLVLTKGSGPDFLYKNPAHCVEVISQEI